LDFICYEPSIVPIVCSLKYRRLMICTGNHMIYAVDEFDYIWLR
jgi:hypothetical protein